jgi:pullulanase/glycogen debranching enzyme
MLCLKIFNSLLFTFLLFSSCSKDLEIQSVRIQGTHLIQIRYHGTPEKEWLSNLEIEPTINIDNIDLNDTMITIQTSEAFQLDQHYFLKTNRGAKIFLIPDGILDSIHSEKPLGYQIENNRITFRVFSPRARWIRLLLYQHHADEEGEEYVMEHDKDGVWEFSAGLNWQNKYYGYRIWGPPGHGEMFDSTVVVADPYSPAVVSQNHYRHIAKTIILPESDFNWEEDNWQKTDWRDLIIYEMHVRDLTAHHSSELTVKDRGTYTGLIKSEQKGGLPYIQSLGVNAVELLPSQDFGNIEIPYLDQSAPVLNTWSPYARNHWGYMTSYFFAPESYYSSGGTMEAGAYNGADGRQVREFKEMVKAFHRDGKAVLMDVVYNHVSQYDYQPLKYIDKFYYFRLNEDCSFTSVSGCGNDLKTERPMARRLILDSVIHWMKEYHIDGFRFDLAKLIDWKTIEAIRDAARRVNPHVILIAEPWVPGYDPDGFSDRGWAAWNDQIRNGVKGQNPHDDLGFIFGAWQGNNNSLALKRFVMGSLREFGGQFVDMGHSVNYLESHDDHTLGDFIRIGLEEVEENQPIEDSDLHAKLTAKQMKLNKLAALFLLTSQGPSMIHQGQEFARSKVIAQTEVPDTNAGKIDHNSYNKDNETNWLNFQHAETNADLLYYYRGLIRMRQAHPAFRRAEKENISFIDQPDSLFISYNIDYKNRTYYVMMNGNSEIDHYFDLPAGSWWILADAKTADAKSFRMVEIPSIMVPASSGLVVYR